MVFPVGADGFAKRDDGCIAESKTLSSDQIAHSTGSDSPARVQHPVSAVASHLDLKRFGDRVREIPGRIRNIFLGSRAPDVGGRRPPGEHPSLPALREDAALLETYVRELHALRDMKIPPSEEHAVIELHSLPRIVAMLNETRPGIDLLTFDTMPMFIRLLNAWRNDPFHIRAIVNVENRLSPNLVAMDVHGHGQNDISIIAVDGDRTKRRANAIKGPLIDSPVRVLVFCNNTEPGSNTSSTITRALYHADQMFANAKTFNRYHDQVAAGTIGEQLGVRLTLDSGTRVVPNGDLILPASFMRYSGVPESLPFIASLRPSVLENAPVDVREQDAKAMEAFIAESEVDLAASVLGIDNLRISYVEATLNSVRAQIAAFETALGHGPNT